MPITVHDLIQQHLELVDTETRRRLVPPWLQQFPKAIRADRYEDPSVRCTTCGAILEWPRRFWYTDETGPQIIERIGRQISDFVEAHLHGWRKK